VRARRSSHAIAVTLAGLLGLSALTVAESSAGTPLVSGLETLPAVAFAPIGRYTTGLGAATAEVAVANGTRLYVLANAIGAPAVDVVDIADPASPQRIRRVDLSAFGGGVNGIAVKNGLVALAVEAAVKTNPGVVLIFRESEIADADAAPAAVVPVGALPDMLTFDETGDRLLVANEGEPSSYGQPDSVDPEGSVSIITVAPTLDGATQVKTATFREFNVGAKRHRDLQAGVRIYGPGATVAQDIEPEYIAVSGDRAYVTLQENNAIAEINTGSGKVIRITDLGRVDHSIAGAGLDPSDRDSLVKIANWPVAGMYQPDAIGAFTTGGETLLITADEGDARDYTGFAEEIRVGAGGYPLDPTKFPNASSLKNNANLGRLTVTRSSGDTDGDGDFDRIDVFGGRSVTIRNTNGAVVWSSGDLLEQVTAAAYPANFNDSGDNTFDTRSDNKGPEPEGVTTGRIGDRTYAFVVLERIGGMVVLDVTDPAAPTFVQYTNTRGFGSVPDVAPETVQFVPAEFSPSGKPRVIVGHEVTGSVLIYELIDPDGAGTLTLLHNNDGESSLLSQLYGTLPVGGAAAYKTVTDREGGAARIGGSSVLNVYAGDSFLASSVLACSLPPQPATTPLFDAVAQRLMPYDLHVFGNHEFDFGPDLLQRYIEGFRTNGLLTQPFLSANLDFSAEPGLAALLAPDGLIVGQTTDGGVIARSAIVTDRATGQRVGVVGATTPDLPTISSPRGVVVTSSDLPSTAAIVQDEVDRLTSFGVKRVILVSHLQSVANDRELAPLLHDVDALVAGGGDDLLYNDPASLLPGEPQPKAGDYPVLEEDATGTPVPIVTTAGNYKYLGRLDLTFDADGTVTSTGAASGPKRVIPTSPQATALGLTDAVAKDPAIVDQVETPLNTCLAAYASTNLATTEVVLNVARGSFTAATQTASRGVRTAETNGGNLATDGFIDSYDRYAADFGLPPRDASNPVVAVQNGGGLRQTGTTTGGVLPVGGVVPGVVTRQNTLDFMAFLTNTMTVVNDVTPAELEAIFERSAAVPGGGQFLQVGGMSVVLDYTEAAQTVSNPPTGQQAGSIITPGARVVSITLADGTPIVAAGAAVPGAPNVRVVTNSFTAAGGDNYPTFEDIPAARKVNLPATYEQALVEYLTTLPIGGSSLPTISAADPRYAPAGEGRIVINGITITG
jgi:2',3'-cyclic-nucleotide 2'-phosphodiesterase / 3'-nucleotidase / 5'-nucleotidase